MPILLEPLEHQQLAPDSSNSGFLPVFGESVSEDNELDDIIHDWLVGVSGLVAQNIRPRWTAEPANLPVENVNWLAFGISSTYRDTNAMEVHDGSVDGSTTIVRAEQIEFILSFYGPNAEKYCKWTMDGAAVSQNRDYLIEHSISLVKFEGVIRIPELIKNKWYNRVDTRFIIRRQTKRQYAIRNILSADSFIDNEHYKTEVKVHE